MANNTGIAVTYGSVGVAAEVSALSTRYNQVSVINTHATQSVYARVFTSNTSMADAQAKATATPAVAGAAENFYCAPGGSIRRVVHRSKQPLFVALSVIATGAATVYEVHGSTFIIA